MSDYLIGLTGGIASGKSALEAAFAARGAFVADADRIARALVEPGQDALRDIVARFGAGVLREDGTLDRAALRRHVFDDAQAKKDLEAILHPRIRAELHRQCLQAPGAYAIASVPLLAEGGGRVAYPWLDRILVVDVDVDVQRARLMARDGIDAALAEKMIAAQASRQQRLAIADDIVANDGPLEELQRAAEGLDALYLKLAASS